MKTIIGHLALNPQVQIVMKKNRGPFGSKRFDFFISAFGKSVPLIRGVAIEWARIRIAEIVAQKGQGEIVWKEIAK